MNSFTQNCCICSHCRVIYKQVLTLKFEIKKSTVVSIFILFKHKFLMNINTGEKCNIFAMLTFLPSRNFTIPSIIEFTSAIIYISSRCTIYNSRIISKLFHRQFAVLISKKETLQFSQSNLTFSFLLVKDLWMLLYGMLLYKSSQMITQHSSTLQFAHIFIYKTPDSVFCN